MITKPELMPELICMPDNNLEISDNDYVRTKSYFQGILCQLHFPITSEIQFRRIFRFSGCMTRHHKVFKTYE